MVYRMSPCDQCHSGCCRAFAIPVNGADILRIERDLQLSFNDFVCRWPDPSGSVTSGHAPQFYFEDRPRTPYAICLRRAPSQYLAGVSRCLFLQETPPTEESPLGRAHCGIYGARPAACRVFPTRFNASGTLAVITEVAENACPDDPHPALNLCPRPWEVEDIDPIASLQDLVIERFENAFFHEVAAAWNDSPGPWELFPEFLHLIYQQRVQGVHQSREDAPAQPTLPLDSLLTVSSQLTSSTEDDGPVILPIRPTGTTAAPLSRVA